MWSIRAHFDGRTIVPDEPVNLPRHQSLVVHVEAHEVAEDAHADALSNLMDLAVETHIPDLARNVDHYLYGHPRRAVDDP